MSRDFRLFLRQIIPAAEWKDQQLDLEHTPRRYERMWREELLAGYRPGAEAALVKSFTMFPATRRSPIVTEAGIPFSTVCAHHLLPFMGVAHIGYLPGRKIVGLSKIPRVLDHFSAMLQIQERLSEQVADFLETHLKPRAVFVLLEAEHQCMALRGVRKSSVVTATPTLRGLALRQPRLVDEFYALVEPYRRRRG